MISTVKSRELLTPAGRGTGERASLTDKPLVHGRQPIDCRVVAAASALCLNLERKFRKLLLPILAGRSSIQDCLSLIFGHGTVYLIPCRRGPGRIYWMIGYSVVRSTMPLRGRGSARFRHRPCAFHPMLTGRCRPCRGI